MDIKHIYYAAYDATSTTGYKCLAVVKVDIASGIAPREAATRAVCDALHVASDAIWLQLSVEIQHKLHPIALTGA